MELNQNMEEAEAAQAAAAAKADAIEGKNGPALDLEAENVDKMSRASDMVSKQSAQQMQAQHE
jgi:hypothetical protein